LIEPCRVLLISPLLAILSGAPTLAQVSPGFPVSQAAPLTQPETQVILNGRSLNVAWSQRQQSIGISDTGLMRVVGVELKDTSDANRQPVQWFSQSSFEPLELSTWLTGQYRYLDITGLAQQQGWQVRPNGTTLQISTPAARVMNVRQGKQSWGDRIVVDLDRATPWQVSEQGEEVNVSLDAQINPVLVQNFVAVPGNRITALKVQASGNQMRIRVGIPTNLRPHVWTLSNPDRLVIDIRPDVTREQDIAWAPGIRWRQQIVQTSAGQFPVISLTVNLRQPGLVVKPIWSNPTTSVGTAPLSTIAQQWQVAAAINGGFFNRNNQLPLGAIRQDNRWVSGPILNRGAIAWDNAGNVAIDRLSLQESVTTTTGQRFSILALNSGYVQAGIARYTSDWGSTYAPILDNETVITVQGDRVIHQQSGGVAGQLAIPIPTNGYLLVVRANRAAASALTVDTGLTHDFSTHPSEFIQLPQILGAGPLLLQNRQIVLNPQAEQFTDAFIRQAAIRSAIGTTPDGNLLLVTIQNRLGGSGPTLTEAAQVMQQLGTIDALNLDGGSSTTLYLGGQLLNRAPQTAARVHNGIGIFIQPTP
jgi:hypothetical protein